MPDQFKRFLQEHNTDFYQRNVPKDIFEDIMQKTISSKTSSKINSKNTSFRSTYFIIGIAASLLIVFIANYSHNFNDEIIQKPIAVKSSSQTDSPEEKMLTNISLTNTTSEIISNSKNAIRNLNVLAKINNANTFQSSIKKVLVTNQFSSYSDSAHLLPENNSSNVADIVIPSNKVADTSSTINYALHTTDNTLEKVSGLSIQVDKTLSIPSFETDAENHISNSIRNEQSLDHKIKKGIFSFLSKKSRKWSNNIIAIDPQEKDSSTTIAINIKNNNFEFSKSLRFNSNH